MSTPKSSLHLPPGLKKIWGGAAVEQNRGIFRHAICADEGGQCYMHIETLPIIPDTLVQATGQTREEVVKGFNVAFEKRISQLMEDENGTLFHSNPSEGRLTYNISGINLKNVKFHGDHPSAFKANKLHARFGSGENNPLHFQADFALYDYLNSLPPRDLKSALQMLGTLDTERHTQHGAFSRTFEKSPELLNQVEQELGKGGIKDFRYLGFGRTGVCLEGTTHTGKKVAVMIRTGGVNRHPIPQHLQSLHFFRAGPYEVEVTPKLDMKSASEFHLHELQHAISGHVGANGEAYHVTDSVVRNIGLSPGGAVYYLDGDGIEKIDSSGSKVASSADPRWVEPDGTWKQYREFEAEHRAFNSPLHQGGGKITPALEPLTPSSPTAALRTEPTETRVAAAERLPDATRIDPNAPPSPPTASANSPPSAVSSHEQPRAANPSSSSPVTPERAIPSESAVPSGIAEQSLDATASASSTGSQPVKPNPPAEVDTHLSGTKPAVNGASTEFVHGPAPSSVEVSRGGTVNKSSRLGQAAGNAERDAAKAARWGEGGKIMAGIGIAAAIGLGLWALIKSMKGRTSDKSDETQNQLAYGAANDKTTDAPASFAARDDGKSWVATVSASTSKAERAIS